MKTEGYTASTDFGRYSNTLSHGSRRQNKLLWPVVGVVVVLFFLFLTPWGAFLGSQVPKPPSGAVTTTGTTTAINTSGNNVPNGAQYQIQFSVLDKWAGGGVNAPTVTVYNGMTKLDSGAASSAGIYTTSSFYSAGQSLNVLIVKSNARQYFTVVVPQVPSTVSQSQVFPIVLNFWTLGTYTMSMVDNFGNTYASAACFNMSALAGSTAQCGGSSAAAKPGASPATLTVNIYDSVTNTGYTSSYDPINQVQWSPALTIADSGKVSITGGGGVIPRGSNDTYFSIIPDSALACIQVGQTISGCSTSAAFTVAIGSVAHGSYETQTIKFYGYWSSTYFTAQGSGSPNQVTLASATLKVAF